MIIKQLSVFLENKSGRLTEVTEILAREGINLSALSLADTSEFGILRMVVSDPETAYKVLKENNYSVNLTDVMCLVTPNEPGSLMRALKIFSEEGVSVEYLYAFSMGDKALTIIKTENVDRAILILVEYKMQLLKASELYQF